MFNSVRELWDKLFTSCLRITGKTKIGIQCSFFSATLLPSKCFWWWHCLILQFYKGFYVTDYCNLETWIHRGYHSYLSNRRNFQCHEFHSSLHVTKSRSKEHIHKHCVRGKCEGKKWTLSSSFKTIPTQDADWAQWIHTLSVNSFSESWFCLWAPRDHFLIPKFSLQKPLNKCMLHYSHYSIMTVFPPAF